MGKVSKEIEILDEHHVFIDGMQFISLTRFGEVRCELQRELDICQRKMREQGEMIVGLLKELLEVRRAKHE